MQKIISLLTKLIMKKIVSFVLSLAFAGSTFAQMSGYSSSSYSEGTALGSNETLTADGIALGNAVKLRGYIDTRLSHVDTDGNASNPTDISAAADIDFLIDLSPVTAELHLDLSESNDSQLLEQAFGRYSFNQDLHLTFGRQVTVLGYEGDESTQLFAVTRAFDGIELNGVSHPGKNYVDGVRLGYNNGMFGLIFGLHDSYTGIDNGNTLDDGMAIDLAASIMFFPGLEAQLGFVNDSGDSGDDDTQVVNGWIEWNPGDLTLAFEFDTISHHDVDVSDIMLLANYRFADFFAASLRYSYMNADFKGGPDLDANRITLAALLSITQNFDVNFEYSHTAQDNADKDEFYVQGLITY
jgi:hypothetical protein